MKIKLTDVFEKWVKETGRFAYLDRSKCVSCGMSISGNLYWHKETHKRYCYKCACKYIKNQASRKGKD